jgi:hypothetical protein
MHTGTTARAGEFAARMAASGTPKQTRRYKVQKLSASALPALPVLDDTVERPGNFGWRVFTVILNRFLYYRAH